jgi:hypothetical protein
MANHKVTKEAVAHIFHFLTPPFVMMVPHLSYSLLVPRHHRVDV